MLDTAQTENRAPSGEDMDGPAEESAMRPPLVCVGVCPFLQSSPLLPKALASLVLQKAPRDRSYRFLVAGPADNLRLQSMVEAAAIHSHFPMRFLALDCGQGLAEARNLVLTEARSCGAEWIAFLGETETAPPGWLIKMVAAARRHEAQIVQGPVTPSYSEPRPFWAVPDSQVCAEGEVLRSVVGRNVLLSAAALGRELDAVTFDPSIADGEEQAQDFFARAAQSGARIVYSSRPAIRRVVMVEELRLSGRMLAAFRAGQGAVHRAEMDGPDTGSARGAATAIVRGARSLAAALILMPFDIARFKTELPQAAQRLSRGLGTLSALMQLRGAAIVSASGVQTLRRIRFR